MVMVAAVMNSKNLKLRRHNTAANPQDYDHVECGGGGTMSLVGVSSSSSSASASGSATTDNYLKKGDRCTSECVIVTSLRIILPLFILGVLPLVVWDGYPKEWGVLHIYPVIRHIDMVWSSLLHTSVWPIVVGTLLASVIIPRGGFTVGGAAAKYQLVGRRKESATDKKWSFLAAVVSNITQSNWKTSLVLSTISNSFVFMNMALQMGYPHALWNPFMWGWYHVYMPENISPSLNGACLDFTKHATNEATAATRQPLCLAEKEWNELSSGQLSSYNPDDVLAVQKGLDYLQNQSGGVIVNALARNVADAIPALRQNMDGLAPFFTDSQHKLSLVIFENDSNDGTREALQMWSDIELQHKSPRYTVDLMSCGAKNPNCELGIMDRYDNMNLFKNPTASGVGKLGEFRQILLEYIMGKDEYKDYSHMVVLDVDLGTSISPLGLLHTLGLEKNLAHDHVVATSSSQVWPGTMGSLIPPYDLSAFRPKETKTNEKVRTMHESFCNLMPAGDRWRNMCEACSPMQLFMIQSANDATNHHNQPYEVVSAFNGLTMYPMENIRNRGDKAKYDAGDDGQRCEHVGFNLSLNKPMYVNPKWSMNLKPEKPGGPTGIRAIKTLSYAVLGRPNVMFCLVLGNFIFFWLVVYSVYIIGIAIKMAYLLLRMPKEKKCSRVNNVVENKREMIHVNVPESPDISSREL